MSIFDTLKNAIFGSHAQAAAKPAPAPNPAPQQTAAQPAPAPTPASVGQGAGGGAPVGQSAAGQVDIAAVLNQKAATKHEKLNWQSSIVDLMKLVDLDSSLANRKALAKELGYSGNMEDSAGMNIWLHKEVMTRLAASGGKVPDSLKH